MKPLWFCEGGRGRGRIERMLRAAVEAGMQDKAVFVVTIAHSAIPKLLKRTLALAPGLRRVNTETIWCPGGGYVRFVAAHDGMLRGLMKRGAADFAVGHARTVTMIDHRVIEQEMGFGLDQWLHWCRED